jgi:hypothetical protein
MNEPSKHFIGLLDAAIRTAVVLKDISKSKLPDREKIEMYHQAERARLAVELYVAEREE